MQMNESRNRSVSKDIVNQALARLRQSNIVGEVDLHGTIVACDLYCTRPSNDL